MTFYDIYQSQYLQYSKSRGRSFKKLSREDRAAEFLKQAGTGLRKILDDFIDQKKEVDFRLLPETAKDYFGRDYVAKRKRENIWDKAYLLRLTGQKFRFNEENELKDFLKNHLKDSDKPGFFTDFIDDSDEYNLALSAEEVVKIVISGKGDKFRNEKQVYKYLDALTGANDSDAYWEGYGLFTADSKKYKLIINIILQNENTAPAPG